MGEERCLLCNMEVTSLAIHQKLNHKKLKLSTLRSKSTLGFRRSKATRALAKAASKVKLETCHECGMDNIENMEQHILIRHTMKQTKNKPPTESPLRRKLDRTRTKLAQSEEAILAEKVKNKLHNFKIQKKLETVMASIVEYKSGEYINSHAEGDVKKYNETMANICRDKCIPQQIICPFCDKTMFYGMVLNRENQQVLKYAASHHMTNCRPNIQSYRSNRFQKGAGKYKTSDDKIQHPQVKIEDGFQPQQSLDDNVLFKVINTKVGGRRKSTIVIDGYSIAWSGTYCTDLFGNDTRLDNPSSSRRGHIYGNTANSSRIRSRTLGNPANIGANSRTHGADPGNNGSSSSRMVLDHMPILATNSDGRMPKGVPGNTDSRTNDVDPENNGSNQMVLDHMPNLAPTDNLKQEMIVEDSEVIYFDSPVKTKLENSSDNNNANILEAMKTDDGDYEDNPLHISLEEEEPVTSPNEVEFVKYKDDDEIDLTKDADSSPTESTAASTKEKSFDYTQLNFLYDPVTQTVIADPNVRTDSVVELDSDVEDLTGENSNDSVEFVEKVTDNVIMLE